MSNKIVLKKSSISDKVPLSTDLDYGELAINYNDGKLYYKDNLNAINAIASRQSTSGEFEVGKFNQILMGINTYVRDYASGYSTTHTPTNPQEIGRITFTGNSQNITIIGEIRGATGASVGICRFILDLRSNILPSKSFTLFEEEITNLGRLIRVRVYQDTASGLVVIGYSSPDTLHNIGWSLKIQERGNYNYFQQVTNLTALDTTGLTEVNVTSTTRTISGDLVTGGSVVANGITLTGNTGTVTSVSGNGTISGLTLTGTVTNSGNITLGGTLEVTASNFSSQTAKTFLAAPNAAAGIPTFRTIVASDIPTLNQNTTGTASNVTGTVAVANGGTGGTTQDAARTGLGATIIGSNLFTLNNPSAITFPRFNADNTVSALTAEDFKTAIGPIGTITSISTNNGITGGTITSSGTIGLTGQALALHNLNTNGVIARTGSGTVAARTITAGTGITISNGDGVSGNPTITNSAPHQATNLSYTASTRELASSTGTNVTLPLATTTNAGLMASTDKTKLDGIANNANNYSLPNATTAITGGVRLGSDTQQTVAANAVTSTASRTYAVQVNASNQMLVNVPWVDTNTTYSAGNGISLSSTTFSVAAGDGLTQEAAGLAVDSTVLRTTSDQTITGTKTIRSSLLYQSPDQTNTISSNMLNGGTLSFEGTSGQLFSITDSLTGTIFSVNDISGIPSIEVLDTGLIKLAEYSGNVLIGSSVDNGTNTLQVGGSAAIGTKSANYLSITGATVGNAVSITTAGSDANIDLSIATKGTGAIIIDTGTGAGQIDLKPGSSNVRLWDDDSSHYYQFVTNNRTANYNINLPAGDVTLTAGTSVVTTRSISTTAPLSGGGDLSANRTLSLASGYGDTQNPYASKTANQFLAAPNGTAGVPSFRAIVAADIPTLNQNTTGSAATLTTTRTIWGQNFNGSANVTGSLSNVTTLSMDNVLTNTASGTQVLLKNSTSNDPTVIHRVDGTNYYVLLSNAGTSANSTWNTLRPFSINQTTGLLSSQNGQDFTGGLSVRSAAVFNEDSADVDFRVESNNDVNALFVDGGTDRVGIGTGTPSNKLDVIYDSSETNLTANVGTSVTAGLRVHNTNTTNNTYAYVDLRAGSSDIRLASVTKGSNSSDFVILNDNGDVTLDEQFRITSAGSVGIGTSSPGTKLAVAGLITELYNSTYWNVVSQADIGTDPNQVPLNQYLGQLAFADEYSPSGLRRTGAGSNDVSVDSNGNVGIGTASPNTLLHVYGSSDPTIKIQSDGTDEISGRLSLRQSNNTGADILYDGTGAVESLVVKTYTGGTFTADGMRISLAGDVTLPQNLTVNGYAQVDNLKLETNTLSTTTGALGLSPANKTVYFGSTNSVLFNIETTSSTTASYPQIGINNFSNNGGFPVVELRNAKGTSASILDIGNSTILGGFNTWGWGGTTKGWKSATRIEGVSRNTFASDATVSAALDFRVTNANAQSVAFRADFDSYMYFYSGAVINENGNNVDTRIEGDTDVNLVFVDASVDRVGIGTSSPAQKLSVAGTLGVSESGQTGGRLLISTSGSGAIINQNDNSSLSLQIQGNTAIRISSTQNVSIGYTTDQTYKLAVNGSFAATTKSFVIDHPTKPGKKLRYGSLEGPENGVYVRGKLKGNVIELPEYWTKLVDPDSITVQLTPIGKYQKLYVEDVRDNKVYVANDSMFGGEVHCFYYVLAERMDVEKLEVEID